ncbi:hypothetical protein MP638_004586 [Amoeboaphelidium occidentale]|nr:hypothetical protein MP638_004586 [Amoeboaphelidium occidentale]
MNGGGGGVVHSFVKSTNDSGLYGIVTTTTDEDKKKKDYIVHYDLLSQKQNPIIELDSFPSSVVVIRDYLVYCCFSNCLKVYDTRQPLGKAEVLECGFTGVPPLTCLDVDCNYNLAVGTEMVKDDAFVRVYDVRSISNNQYKMEFTESFSNDLSQLEFYRGFLLTSSTDGLSCLFDLNSNTTAKNLTIKEEEEEDDEDDDDYLVRVFNSDAAVYRFGVYCDEYLYTMSHQNTVQLFNMNSGSKMFDCSSGGDGSAVINTEAVGSDLIVYTQQSLDIDNQYSIRVNRCTLENGLEKVLEFQSDAYVNDAKIVGKDLSSLLVVGATDDGIRVFSHHHQYY